MRAVAPRTLGLAEAALGGGLALGQWLRRHPHAARALVVGTAYDLCARGPAGLGLGLAIGAARPALRGPIVAGLALSARRRLGWFAGHALAATAALSAVRAVLPGPRTDRRAVVVVNAHAGSTRLTRRALTHLHRLDSNVGVIVAPRDAFGASLSAAARQSPEVLIVAGGDGSISGGAEVAADHEVVLGILPTGTGNDTARGLRIPLGPEDAASVAIGGVETAIDLGLAGTRLFVHAVSVGVIARFAEAVQHLRGRARPLLYPLAAWRVWRHYDGVRLEVSVDGQPVHFPGTLVELAVVNTPRLGGRLGISLPPSLAADGRLTAIAVTRSPLSLLVRSLASMMQQRPHHPHGTLLTRDARVITLTSATPTLVAIDGEPIAETPIDLRTLPARLRVHVPAQPRRWRGAASDHRTPGDDEAARRQQR
ncbi:diacylglycerol kinase catalytic region [Acidimicrobium ferrooxidans DSM 10331]|uniref:Diacylglycerol kinase catalytic region n=1 Tax=Acidimicrobium ferrooxidans (strain DSM 10331 / JCM 15462 / NBRC 103882 / ICP) TaxID=525909 RepID=C7M0Z2_ACIFD|nr:diacylglycerol kinase family protein [Acidimicrobium ferrooxidans]ACU54650.1 diacylglycerol kinase catalytic region [Acidimicrobium ferrooxidans DSM 10331]